MKKIINKKIGDDSCMATYRQALVTPEGEGGASYDEMKRVMPIIEKIDDGMEMAYILLEDAEHAELVKRVKNLKFNFNDQALIDIIDNVIDAKDVDVTEEG